MLRESLSPNVKYILCIIQQIVSFMLFDETGRRKREADILHFRFRSARDVTSVAEHGNLYNTNTLFLLIFQLTKLSITTTTLRPHANSRIGFLVFCIYKLDSSNI